jgi:hypothetical protein
MMSSVSDEMLESERGDFDDSTYSTVGTEESCSVRSMIGAANCGTDCPDETVCAGVDAELIVHAFRSRVDEECTE